MLKSSLSRSGLIGHVIMHGAAVFHGIESTPQLPPHFPHSMR